MFNLSKLVHGFDVYKEQKYNKPNCPGFTAWAFWF